MFDIRQEIDKANAALGIKPAVVNEADVSLHRSISVAKMLLREGGLHPGLLFSDERIPTRRSK